jgi:hypothetical protein
MAARKSTGAARHRARSNQVRTHPPGKSRRKPAPTTPECPKDHDPLLRLSRAIALVETIELAMRMHEASLELGPVCTCL